MIDFLEELLTWRSNGRRWLAQMNTPPNLINGKGDVSARQIQSP